MHYEGSHEKEAGAGSVPPDDQYLQLVLLRLYPMLSKEEQEMYSQLL